MRLKDDQRVSLAIKDPETGKQIFRFYDFFHSGLSYRKAYSKAGFKLIETLRPMGKSTDGIQWHSEMTASPYKIHVLYPDRVPKLTYKIPDNNQIKAKL